MRSRSSGRARATTWFRVTAAAASAAALGTLGLAGTGTALAAPHAPAHLASPTRLTTLADDSASACHLGNGIQHVVQITFDNVRPPPSSSAAH